MYSTSLKASQSADLSGVQKALFDFVNADLALKLTGETFWWKFAMVSLQNPLNINNYALLGESSLSVLLSEQNYPCGPVNYASILGRYLLLTLLIFYFHISPIGWYMIVPCFLLISYFITHELVLTPTVCSSSTALLISILLLFQFLCSANSAVTYHRFHGNLWSQGMEGGRLERDHWVVGRISRVEADR